MTEETAVGFNVNEEVVVHDLENWKDDAGVVPKAQGVRVRLVKPEIRVSYKDNGKTALPKGSPDNPWAFKYLNFQCAILDGIETDMLDEEGKPTGQKELKYKNKVVFPGRMDLVFAHNPEVKNSEWWNGRKYLGGFKSLCTALGMNLKEVRVGDAFLEQVKDREVLIDIEHEEQQDLKDVKQADGTTKKEYVSNGTFKERVRKFTKWE